MVGLSRSPDVGSRVESLQVERNWVEDHGRLAEIRFRTTSTLTNSFDVIIIGEASSEVKS